MMQRNFHIHFEELPIGSLEVICGDKVLPCSEGGVESNMRTLLVQLFNRK